MDGVGHILGGRSTIGSVELDTKVIIGTTWVVGSSEENTTISLEGSDKCRASGGGEDGVLAENDVLDAVGSTDTEDNLGCLGRLKTIRKWGGKLCISYHSPKCNVSAVQTIDLTHEVSSITTNNNGLALRTSRHSGEDGLNKIFGVVLLLEDLDPLSKTGRTGLLACQGELAMVPSSGECGLARVGLCLDGYDIGPIWMSRAEICAQGDLHGGVWVFCGRRKEERGRKEDMVRMRGGEWTPAAARAHNTETPTRIRQELQPHTPHQFPRVAHVVPMRS